jgi:hypothetical protein
LRTRRGGRDAYPGPFTATVLQPERGGVAQIFALAQELQNLHKNYERLQRSGPGSLQSGPDPPLTGDGTREL